MRVDETKCTGCGRCQELCTMTCISFARGPGGRIVSFIDEDECVDCGVCERSGVCGPKALHMPITEWPRTVRGTFSNPMAEHKETKVPGRGTEEMKTNDVTGRFQKGHAGMSIELGRPGVGARLKDAGTIAMRLHQMGIRLEPKNPLTNLLVPETYECLPAVKNEKVLSAILEFIVPVSKVADVIAMIRDVETQIDTVISIDLVYRNEEGSPALAEALSTGENPYPNGKVNVGLGQPRFVEVD